MSVLAGVFDDLNHMSQLQLLLAFTACIAAVLTLGGREVAPDGDPVDYTTFSLMRILKRRQARVVI